MMQPGIAIVLVPGLLLAILIVLRKKGLVSLNAPRSGRAARQIEVVERVALGPHHALHLVRAGDRCLVVATAPSSCQVLDAFFGREAMK